MSGTQGAERPVESVASERDWVRVVARETCEECGLRASAPSRRHLAGALLEGAWRWETLLGGTDPSRLRRSVEPGRWSALEYGGHTAGVLGLFADRIELALALDDPELGWWDHEEAAIRERYNEQAPTSIASLLLDNAKRFARTLEPLDEAAWGRTATRRSGERFTVEGFARFTLHEVHHHLHDAHRVLDVAESLAAARYEDPGFGRVFTDHMALARFSPVDGWAETEVVPFGELSLSPVAMVFHYGQAVFEGLRAFHQHGGAVALFRPDDHAARFGQSARRLAMPEPTAGAFVAACAELVRTDMAWVPSETGHSLYLRPMLFATEAALGVRPASEYLFVVIASPAGAYFASGARPLTVWATREYARAVPGGTGSAKCSGNYAASLAAKQLAAANGCDEILWLDAIEHRWIEELSGQNVVFVADSGDGPTLVAPPVGRTVLDGVTRRSLLELARTLGYEVLERPVSIEEACDPGAFLEAFACGTASGVVPIGVIRLDAGLHPIGEGKPGPVTLRLGNALLAVQEGRADDAFRWRMTVSDERAPRATSP